MKRFRGFFKNSNYQINDNLDDVVRRRTVKEINDDVLTGFSTPTCFGTDLLEETFDMYFTVAENENTDDEEELFKKTFCLHLFFEVLK